MGDQFSMVRDESVFEFAAPTQLCPPELSFSCNPGSSVTCAKRCDQQTECDGGEDEDDCDGKYAHAHIRHQRILFYLQTSIWHQSLPMLSKNQVWGNAFPWKALDLILLLHLKILFLILVVINIHSNFWNVKTFNIQ